MVKAHEAQADFDGLQQRRLQMNPDAIPVVVAIVAVFAIFMAVLGGTAVWTNLPRNPRD